MTLDSFKALHSPNHFFSAACAMRVESPMRIENSSSLRGHLHPTPSKRNRKSPSKRTRRRRNIRSRKPKHGIPVIRYSNPTHKSQHSQTFLPILNSITTQTSQRERKKRKKKLTSPSIPRPGRTHRRLGAQARRLRRRPFRHAAHVDQLVAQRVADDVGVQRLLLPAARERVDDLEGHFRSGAAA